MSLKRLMAELPGRGVVKAPVLKLARGSKLSVLIFPVVSGPPVLICSPPWSKPVVTAPVFISPVLMLAPEALADSVVTLPVVIVVPAAISPEAGISLVEMAPPVEIWPVEIWPVVMGVPIEGLPALTSSGLEIEADGGSEALLGFFSGDVFPEGPSFKASLGPLGTVGELLEEVVGFSNAFEGVGVIMRAMGVAPVEAVVFAEYVSDEDGEVFVGELPPCDGEDEAGVLGVLGLLDKLGPVFGVEGVDELGGESSTVPPD